jgi:hypothetical protein
MERKSGGVGIGSKRIDIEGNVVGRDSIESTQLLNEGGPVAHYAVIGLVVVAVVAIVAILVIAFIRPSILQAPTLPINSSVISEPTLEPASSLPAFRDTLLKPTPPPTGTPNSLVIDSIPTPTSVTTFPTKTATDASPTVTPTPMSESKIDRIWVDHNVFDNDTKGMRIHVAFNVYNLKGVGCNVSAFFYDNSSGTQLKDRNGKYANINSFVMVGEDFVPLYDSTTYKDFSLFIPLDEFDLDAGDYNLKFRIQLYNYLTQSSFSESDFIEFNFKNNSSPTPSVERYHGVGSTAIFRQQRLKITVNDVREYSSSQNDRNFIVLDITIENISLQEKMAVTMPLNTEIRDESGLAFPLDLIETARINAGVLDGTIAPQEKRQGSVAYLIPKNSKTILWVFKSAVTTEQITFYISPY